MAVYYAPIKKIVPDELAVPKRLGMHTPSFYQQQPQQQESQLPTLPQAQPQAPSTADYVASYAQRVRERSANPQLDPGSTVQNVDPSLSSPENFQGYYRHMATVRQIGQEQAATAQAEAVLRQIQAQQALAQQSARGFSGGSAISGGKAVSGGLQPHVAAVKDKLGAMFGIKNIGGYATSGHIKNSDHYTGKALDFMTYNGQGLADYTVANAGSLGVKYVIWNRQIWQPGSGWTKYTGTSPHTDHVHVSFY